MTAAFPLRTYLSRPRLARESRLFGPYRDWSLDQSRPTGPAAALERCVVGRGAPLAKRRAQRANRSIPPCKRRRFAGEQGGHVGFSSIDPLTGADAIAIRDLMRRLSTGWSSTASPR